MSLNCQELITLSKNNPEKFYIMPFGGCGEFGKNCTALVVKGDLYLIDAGAMFPDHRKLGVQVIVSNIDEWVEAAGGIRSYIITHGHEDHIGALPIYWKKWPAPIYASAWTKELIDRKFGRFGIDPKKLEIHLAEHRSTFSDHQLQFQYLQVNHSIPDAFAILFSGAKEVPKFFHSGDFKIDSTGTFEACMDLSLLSEMGRQGVDLLFADSTNAHQPGNCPPESSTEQSLEQIIKESKGRVVLTTFASNLWRLLTVLKVAKKLKKQIHIIGSGIEFSLSTAHKLKMVDLDQYPIIDANQLSSVSSENLVILASGCQAEMRAGIARLAFEEHQRLKLKKEDTVIFSSRSIPGNERDIAFIQSLFEEKGIKVITARQNPSIHVSGHAYGGDLQQLIDALDPHFYLPIHGNFSQLQANRRQRHYKIKFERPLKNGEVIELGQKVLNRLETLEVTTSYVDAYSNQLLDYETLRSRLKIAEVGLVIVSGCLDLKSETWIHPPTFDGYGINIEEDMLDKLNHQIMNLQFLDCQKADAIEAIRVHTRRVLNTFLSKKPVVICKIQVMGVS